MLTPIFGFPLIEVGQLPRGKEQMFNQFVLAVEAHLSGLTIGEEVQAWDIILDSLSALVGGADKLPYFTSTTTLGETTLTAFARTLLDDIDAATARTTLGAQPLDATLTALAALVTAADKLIYATGVDTFTTSDLTAFARTLLDDADAAAMRVTLLLGALATLSVVGTSEISDNAVTNAKVADMAVNTIKGRITAGTGDPEDLTATQVRTVINVADGANNYVHPNHTGDVTSVGDGAQTIAFNAVTNTKIADMAADTIKGRITAGTGDPEDLTATQVRTILNLIVGTTVQAQDADLQALADNITNGLWARTGAGTGAARTLTQPAAGITVTNGDGVAGNPTLALTDDLNALENLASTGLAARTAANTWAQRTITGTANKVTVTNGDGVSGNPTLTLPDAVTLVTPTVTGLLTVSGGQIAFPATQVPSANANTLDDYEEGTWTPVLTFATPGDLSVAYSVSTGFYTKNGREVCIRFTVATSTFTHTTASGNLLVTGAPFTSLSTSGSASTGPLSFQGINKAGYNQFNASLPANSSAIGFLACESGSDRSNIGSADMPTGGTVVLQSTFNYIAA